jgi:hypothetical protein
MAAGDVARVIRAPGRIVVNPTDAFATGTFPYGGAEIGKTNLCVLHPQGTAFRVRYESLGEIGDVLNASNTYLFSCFLRGWDDDAVRLMLAGGHETGMSSQHAVYAVPREVPGTSALGRAVIIAYVPDDPIHVPGVLIYRGVPDWSDGAQLAFQRGTELGIPLVVECLRNQAGSVLRVGRLVDLGLEAMGSVPSLDPCTYDFGLVTDPVVGSSIDFGGV